MKIGLYGLPSAGKSYILNRIDFIKVYEGSVTMKKLFPEFDSLDENGKNNVRLKFASLLAQEDDFIMDGHYSFGDKIVFTTADGELYDVFIYLYISPEVLTNRMQFSEKNSKYLKFDIEAWQKNEVDALRDYCHRHDKDFFVIDNPDKGYFSEVSNVITFFQEIVKGYSCLNFAKDCADKILQESYDCEKVVLADGDKTISLVDTSQFIYGYTTHIFDNNFYTGYQAWSHGINFSENYLSKRKICPCNVIQEIELNKDVARLVRSNAYILTSGDGNIWSLLARRLECECFWGTAMSADTKYFVVKKLREAGKYVIAYGDSMNDYYMLREADEGYLIAKRDGTISRSLKEADLGGVHIVRT